MKPHVICHMVSSVDGRTLNSRWRPDGKLASTLFERLHDELGGDAWLIGRVTGQEFAKGKPYPAGTDQIFPRENWFARRDAKLDVKAYGVALDFHGKISWGRSDIGGDPIVAVLSSTVSDAHLAGLRHEGVSYISPARASSAAGCAKPCGPHPICRAPWRVCRWDVAVPVTSPICATASRPRGACAMPWARPRRPARPASPSRR